MNSEKDAEDLTADPSPRPQDSSIKEQKSNFMLAQLSGDKKLPTQARETQKMHVNGRAFQPHSYKGQVNRIKVNIPAPPTFPNANDNDVFELQREIDQTRADLAALHSRVTDFAKQARDMSTSLHLSNARVSAIEQHLTTTQELNVNLQILLENVTETQREADTIANQSIKSAQFNLATVAYQNGQLQERLSSLEIHQRNRNDCVQDVVERLREYAFMLDQAQGTIRMLLEPRSAHSKSFDSVAFIGSPNEESLDILQNKESLHAFFGSKDSNGPPEPLDTEQYNDHSHMSFKYPTTAISFKKPTPRTQARPREAPMPQQDLSRLFASRSQTPGLGLLTRSKVDNDQ